MLLDGMGMGEGEHISISVTVNTGGGALLPNTTMAKKYPTSSN